MTFATEAPVGRVQALVRRVRDLLTRTDSAALAQRAAAVALVIRLASAALAYVAQVVLARLMGQYEYGVFAYSWIWFLVFGSLATFGFGDSPLRYIAQLRERGEEAHLRGFIRFAGWVIFAGSIASGLLLVAILPLIDHFIEHAYVLPMALMAISIPFACMQGYLEAVGRSFNWTVPALLPVYILRHGLLLAFMAAAVALGFEGTAANAFICLVLTMVVSIAYQAVTILYRLRREITPGPRAYRPREWMQGSMPFAVLYAAQHLSSFGDVLVLSFFVSPAEIAVYFAATRIIQVVNLVPFAATVGTAHLFSASHTRGDHHELQRLCSHVAALTFVIAAAAVAAIFFVGDFLLGMFGEGFEAAYTALDILALGVLARVAAGPAEDVLNMTGNGALSASASLAMVAVNIALAIALIIPFGIVGAASASAIAFALRAVWLSLAARKRLGVSTSVFSALPRRSTSGASRPALRTPAE